MKRGTVVELDREGGPMGVVIGFGHIEDENGPDGVSTHKLLVVIRSSDGVIAFWHPMRVRVLRVGRLKQENDE